MYTMSNVYRLDFLCSSTWIKFALKLVVKLYLPWGSKTLFKKKTPMVTKTPRPVDKVT